MEEPKKEGTADTTLMGGAATDIKPEAAQPEKTGTEAAPEAAKDPQKDGKPADQEQKKDEPAKVGAPEKYADFKLPEGVVINDEVKGNFLGLAKKLNLSQEAAQELVDLKIQLDQTGAKAQEAQHKAAVEGWKAESLKSLGAEAEKSLAIAAKAKDKFGSPEFVQFMEESGLGNHPAFINFCLNVGKSIREDGFVEGKGGENKPKSVEDRLYPKE